MKRPIDNSARNAITTWVLIVGVLLQPILTYLTTPMLAVDGKGHTVLMCTLNGLEAVYVDNLPALGEQSDEEHCPALKLLQFAGAAQPAVPLQAPPASLYQIALVDVVSEHQHDTHYSTSYPIRAPPMV